jgi:transcriptional regulator with XRE-family HTH domain
MTEKMAAIGVLNALPVLMAHERERRGLSLREAAQQIGVGHVTLWQYEQGKRDVTVRKAVRFLTWLVASASRSAPTTGNRKAQQ